jgi:protein ImuB
MGTEPSLKSDAGAPLARVACVAVPALPLQLMVRDRPGWRDEPAVVVESDRPLSPVLYLNRAARRSGIRRGMKYGQARSLCEGLRAAAVRPDEVRAAVQEIFRLLLRYSPTVEPVDEPPGLFWLDPNGLHHLFQGHGRWAGRVRRALSDIGFVSTVVVGFERYPVYAIARVTDGVRVLASPRRERRLAHRVRLDRLDLPPDLCAELRLLGVDTLGKFVKLSAADLRARYGELAAILHDLASGRRCSPLRGRELAEPIRLVREIEPPDHDRSRLLFAIKGMLHELCGRVAAQCRAITALQILFLLDHAPDHAERVRTAAPTGDGEQLLELIRLRLSAIELAAPVEQIEMEPESVPVHPRQLGLPGSRPRRDLEAAARALARVRAAFGPHAVTRARLRSAHLPEASFCFEPVCRVREPKPPAPPGEMPLVRRFFADRPLLPAAAGPGGGRGNGFPGVHGVTRRVFGPFRVAGGWWRRRVERDYYFVQTDSDQILWVYFDRPRRRWVIHGTVE